MNVFWFLPTHGDSRYLGTSHGGRPVTHRYLKQIAEAADELGFDGVLIPTGRSCEDAWVVASSLAPLTERLKFLVAIRPGVISPTVSAYVTSSAPACAIMPFRNSWATACLSPSHEARELSFLPAR